MGDSMFMALVLSLGGVSFFTAILTEAFPLGASGKVKRGQAVVYSLLLTFVWYLIGQVNVPEIVAPEFSGATWAKFLVLGVAALGSAGMAMLGADGVAMVRSKFSKGE